MVGRRKLSDYRLVFALKGDTAIQQSYKIKLEKQLFIQIIKKLNSPGREGIYRIKVVAKNNVGTGSK